VGDGEWLNRFGYVHGNPETATDPSGHKLCDADCGSGGGTSGPLDCKYTGTCPQTTPPCTHDCGDPCVDETCVPPCQVTNTCSPPQGDPNIVHKDDTQACLSANHPLWCERYYDYSGSGLDIGGFGMRRGPFDLIGMADYWVFSGGGGILIAGVYAFVYYIPTVGQWWSPSGFVIGFGGWYGFSVGLKDIPSLAVGFGILLTKDAPASVQELHDFLAGPSDTHEEDYGLHSWSEASNGVGYAWEYHLQLGLGATWGQSCGWIESFPWQWFPPQFNHCPGFS
jgi:hypothetical protein